MKKNLTELVIIIDKSGSMSGLEEDVVGGFNSLIEEQKKLEGEVKVTTILFNHHFEYLYENKDIREVAKMSQKDYVPSGCTALLDTIGNAINKTAAEHLAMKEEEIPEHTIFSIMTDGLENSSVEYHYAQIHTMIEKKKAEGWDFLFQAANIDAIGESSKLGISRDDTVSFNSNVEGVRFCFRAVSNGVAKKRKDKKTK